ncbi:MAG: isoprenyl transferase [bacterium]
MTSSSQHSPGEPLVPNVKQALTRTERELLLQIIPDRIPAHVAIIMDGNGRWARRQGFIDRIRGHEAGSQSVREAVGTASELGMKTLTLYAFSTENWQRPAAEIKALMLLLEKFLREKIGELNENNVRLIASGRISDLGPKVVRVLNHAIDATSANTGLTLNLALSYSGRAELTDAARRIAAEARNGTLDPDAITEADISARMYHAELDDPDLLIRTSGEMRISNFLLWQIAYTEIYVTPVLWPDFRRRHFYEAALDYQKRERRFGKETRR